MLKFLLFLSLWLFTGFSYSQTTKVVAGKSCEVQESCPANSTGSGLKWSGMTIYDWWDHDSNPSTLDILGWSQCTKKTVANSGSVSVITEDNCTCHPNFTKTHSPNCVGKSSCACICNINCTSPWVRNDSTCSCECSLTSCPSGYALNTSSCSCQCNQTCGLGYTLNLGTCACERNCTPQRCTPRKRCTNGTWISGDTRSGTRQCDSSGNLSSVCTGGTYSTVCPTPCTRVCNSPFVVNDDCTGCVCGLTQADCSAGKTLNPSTCACESDCTDQDCTVTRPCQTGTGTETAEGIRRCDGNGVLQACRRTGDWDASGCTITPICNSQNCPGPCKECINGRCRNKSNTNWSPPLLDPYNEDHCDQTRNSTRCRNGVLETQDSSGPDHCAPPPECTSDSECGMCKRCNSDGKCVARGGCCTSNSQCGTCHRCSGNQCVGQTTSWSTWNPPWNPSRHCSDQSQRQTRTRCLSGSRITGNQTVRGTVRSRRCTPPDKNCPAGTTGTWRAVRNSGTQSCRNGRLGSCTGGRWIKKCCRPQRCTPANKNCPAGTTGTWRAVRNSGTRQCDNGRLSNQCTGGRWTKRCTRPCNPEPCTPSNKRCSNGTIQTPTGSGQYECKNGRVDRSRCVYNGGWSPSECPPSACRNGRCRDCSCHDTLPNKDCFQPATGGCRCEFLGFSDDYQCHPFGVMGSSNPCCD